MWFRGLRLKLLLLTAIPIVLLSVLSVGAYSVITGLQADVKEGALVSLPLATYCGRMAGDMHASVRFYWSVPASGRNASERASFIEKTRRTLDDFDDAAKKYEALPRSASAKEIYKTVPENWMKVKSAYADGLAAFALNTQEGDDKASEILVQRIRPIANDVEEKLRDLNDARLKDQAARTDEIMTQEATQMRMMLGFMVTSITGLIIFGLVIASRLAATFTGVARGISQTVHEFGSASGQLSNASQTLSAGASEAASSLEETVASLEELSSMVQQNASNSKEAGTISNAAKLSAEEGEGEVRQLVEAMHEISQSSKQIEEIIAVIDDLAFQTNLLALNAAVEAARAGEQGKGFAVVAEAVRGLAQKSGEAAKNISTLIKESVNRVERGSRTADKSGEVLRAIVTNVKRVADLNQEIASASAEQSTGLAQISKAMNQLDQATQSNAAMAEETAASSEQLSAGAEEVRRHVEHLTEAVDGTARSNSGRLAQIDTRAPANAAPQAGKNNVLSFRRSARKPIKTSGGAAPAADEVIPFDTDTPKVGNTNGF